jgi:hypothetical protein
MEGKSFALYINSEEGAQLICGKRGENHTTTTPHEHTHSRDNASHTQVN